MELRLPPEYQEVEYIENTGTQYIITDLLFPKELENPKIEWGFMQIAVPSGDNMIFGYWSSGSIYYEVYNSTTLSYASIGKNHYDRISNSNLTKDMFIAGVMTKETMYLNEYSYATNAEDTIDQSIRPMAIFAWNSSSGRTYTNKGARIYYLRFFDGNTKMADYVPCYRKSDGEIGMYDTVTKTFYTNSGTDTFLKGADITRYIDNVSVLDTRRKILLNTPYIDTSVGDLVTFNTDLSAPLKSCKVSFSPVQEGEGDPSPDNVRNITGWNGVNIYKAGQNLIPENIPAQFYRVYPSGGHFIESGTAFSTFFIPVPKGKICLARTTRNLISYGALCDEPPTVGSNAFNVVTMTNRDNHIFDNSEGHKYFAITTGRKVEANSDWDSFLNTEPRLTIGDTVQPYTAPTNISTHSIDWTDSTGTVYSGYVDLINGELVADMAIKTTTWGETEAREETETSITKRVKLDFTPVVGSHSKHISNIAPHNTQSVLPRFTTTKTSYANFMFEPNAAPSDTDIIQVCYELAEPIRYQLTPQQLLTLKGINNVYSNTNGQTEIKYWKH